MAVSISRTICAALAMVFTALLPPVIAEAAETAIAATPQQTHESATADLDHVAKELNNPLTSFWSISNEIDLQWWKGDYTDEKLQAVWNFKPVMPIDLGHGWMYVNRPTIPIVFQQPYLNRDELKMDYESGLGDIQYFGLVGKNLPDGFVLAGGATFIFPSASDDALGQGKWQAGPALAAAVLKKRYILGALYQQWWSFAGQDDRNNTNLSALQIFYFLNFPGGWQVGGAPVLTANWMEDDENRFNVPLGLGVYKMFRLGKLPVKVGVEYEHSIVKEDTWGREDLIKIVITPVLPSFF